jgi:hypothetical protein
MTKNIHSWNSLFIADKQDARVHYAHLNQQPTTTRTQAHQHQNLGRYAPTGVIDIAENQTLPQAENPATEWLVFSDIQQGVCADRGSAPLTSSRTSRFPHPLRGCTSELAVAGMCACWCLRHMSPGQVMCLPSGPGRLSTSGCSLERR